MIDDPIILKQQNALLRRTLREALNVINGTQWAGAIVDLARPNVGLVQHIRRVLRDTRSKR